MTNFEVMCLLLFKKNFVSVHVCLKGARWFCWWDVVGFIGGLPLSTHACVWA